MPLDRLMPTSVSPAFAAGPADPTLPAGTTASPVIAASGLVVLELAVRGLPVDGVSGVNVCCAVA